MMKMKIRFNKNKCGLFAAGVLFGTAGIRLLSSKDAKGVYSQVTAAVLRVKDCVVNQAVTLQENCEDILEEAKNINEERDMEELYEEAWNMDEEEDAAEEDLSFTEEEKEESAENTEE